MYDYTQIHAFYMNDENCTCTIRSYVHNIVVIGFSRIVTKVVTQKWMEFYCVCEGLLVHMVRDLEKYK